MDPFTLSFLAASTPAVVGMFQPRPDYPAFNPQSVNLPDRSQYTNQLLENAFSSNPAMYQRAADILTEKVNRSLATRGLSGPATAPILNDALSRLAERYLQDQISRQSQALGAVNQRDLGEAGINANLEKLAYGSQLGGYQDANARNAGAVSGLSNLLSTAAQSYAQQQAMQNFNDQMAQNRAAFSNAYGPTRTMGPPVMLPATADYGWSNG